MPTLLRILQLWSYDSVSAVAPEQSALHPVNAAEVVPWPIRECFDQGVKGSAGLQMAFCRIDSHLL